MPTIFQSGGGSKMSSDHSDSISAFMATSHLRLSGADLASTTEDGSFSSVEATTTLWPYLSGICLCLVDLRGIVS